jgi:hypothetical protein
MHCGENGESGLTVACQFFTPVDQDIPPWQSSLRGVFLTVTRSAAKARYECDVDDFHLLAMKNRTAGIVVRRHAEGDPPPVQTRRIRKELAI